MKNIEIFDVFAAQIFIDLYESFPVPTGLDWREHGARAGLTKDMQEVHLKRVFHGTRDWLKHTGYIDAPQPHPPEYILTAKGFAALNMPLPESLQGKESFGQRLASLAQRAGTETGRAAMSEVGKQVIIAGTRFLSSA